MDFTLCTLRDHRAFLTNQRIGRTKPEDSPNVSEAEARYIRESEAIQVNSGKEKSFGWLDKFIRYQKVAPLTTFKSVFASWNIWGNILTYFLMNSVIYGILTWVPSYLVNAKGYSFMKMGFIASMPAVGGLLGAILGGFLSDKVFEKRRKPTMLITATAAADMMFVIINIPDITERLLLSVLGLAGIGWPAFTAYPMGLTTRDTYPVAIATVNSGGNLGGFFSPMIVGAILDTTNSYNLVFGYFGFLLILEFLIILSLKEPIQHEYKTSQT
ncbi:MFS transporter [Fictibacillus enclensis]|uniref:MFS transporter n=1 Tax=Fictibacillus enclensis TaxID=1017270 RepID=UPI0024C06153|nr:MFS transporter [Fictibacillus enclensis]WHY71238.1 MFS transporter [Fictibacillus enclensis]